MVIIEIKRKKEQGMEMKQKRPGIASDVLILAGIIVFSFLAIVCAALI